MTNRDDIVDAPDLGADHGRHAALGTLQDLSASGLALLTGVLAAAFLTRQLGPRDYGLLAVATSITVWVELVVTIGPSRTAEKYVAAGTHWRATASTLLRGQILFAMAAAAAAAVVARPLAAWVGTPALAVYLLLFAVDIPLFATRSILNSILIGRGRFSHRAFLNGAFWILRLLLVLVWVGLHPSVSAAIVATLGASLAVVLLSFLTLPVGPLQRSPIPWTRLAGFAAPVVLYAIGLALFSRIDLVLVERFGRGSATSGFYGAALNLAILPAMIAGAGAPLLVAKLSLLDSTGRESTSRAIMENALRAAVLLLPFAGVTAGLSRELVRVVYGGAFEPAAPLLSLLIFAGVGLTLAAIAGESLLGSGLPLRSVALSLPFVGAACVAHVLVIPTRGAIGAAFVTTVSAWVMAAAMVVGLAVARRVRPPIGSWSRACAVAALVWWVGSLWPASSGLMVVKLVALLALAVVGLVLTGELGAIEVDFLVSLVRPRRGVSGRVTRVVPTPERAETGWRESFEDTDLTFYVGCYRDANPLALAVRSVRESFPRARVILISDGDDDPRFVSLARQFGADYRSGERLMGVEHGGRLVQRMLLAFLEHPTAYLFKLDTDTRVHRRFRRLPEGQVVFGTLEWKTALFGERLDYPNVQGGCIGFTLQAARALAESQIFVSRELQDPAGSWADVFDMRYRAERHQLVSDDFITRYGCRSLGIPVVNFPEVRSCWRGAIPRDHDYAITHPHGDSKQSFYPALLRAGALGWSIEAGVSRLLGREDGARTSSAI